MSLPIGAYAPFNISFRDKSGEVGNTSGFGILPEDLEDPIDMALVITAFSNFILSLQAITLGTVIKWRYFVETLNDPVTLPASPSAQRENKLLVRYHDSVTLEKATLTIPTIDLPNLSFETDAKDFVSKTVWVAGGSVMTDFVTRFQAFVRVPRPDDIVSNPSVIDSLQFVGRNT